MVIYNRLNFASDINVLYDFMATVKGAPHERVIRTGQPET